MVFGFRSGGKLPAEAILDDREVPTGAASHQSSAIEHLTAVPTAQPTAGTFFF